MSHVDNLFYGLTTFAAVSRILLTLGSILTRQLRQVAEKSLYIELDVEHQDHAPRKGFGYASRRDARCPSCWQAVDFGGASSMPAGSNRTLPRVRPWTSARRCWKQSAFRPHPC